MPAYSVKYRHVAIAGSGGLKIRSLSDRLQFSDPQGAAEAAGISSATWPLFGLVWPSARKLADLMQTFGIGSRRVLEIGCGLGLASLVIHRRRGDITASDCHPLAETFLRANLRLNRMPAIKYLTGHWGRANPDLGRFDLIIGSDVLYERGHPRELSDFLQIHAAERCEVLIVDPDRGNRNAFSRDMADRGYALAETRLDTPDSGGSPYRGRLLHYSRGSPQQEGRDDRSQGPAG